VLVLDSLFKTMFDEETSARVFVLEKNVVMYGHKLWAIVVRENEY
jgi:hypothetical protein